MQVRIDPLGLWTHISSMNARQCEQQIRDLIACGQPLDLLQRHQLDLLEARLDELKQGVKS